MSARADLDLHPPILLSEERGDGAPDTLIVSGIASASDLLRYADGTDEVTDAARQDTAAGLVGVPIVDPDEHQRWSDAVNAGRPYEVRALGTVIDAALDGDGVRFRAAIHDREATAKVTSKKWPAVSVGYRPRYGASDRADRAQVGRKVNHLALVPRGRDPQARIRVDSAEGDQMPTIGEMDMAAFFAAFWPLFLEKYAALETAEIDAAKPADPPAMSAEDLAAAKADAAAQKSRADAAEAQLAQIEAGKRKERGQVLASILARRGIKPEGYDLVRADAADIAAAERAILDAEISARADTRDPLTPGSTRIAGQPEKPAADKPLVTFPIGAN